ncbi:MAG: hypothetical protein Q3983_03170 [Capnocytophaga sp.]|nr:hypothetical protein [Capnocytophaga sp.]
MKKIVIYILILLCFAPLLLIFSNTLITFSKIKDIEKKTMQVKSCYRNKWIRESVNIYFKESSKQIPCADDGDIRIVVGLLSLRSLPKVNTTDEISYYELNNEYLNKTNLSNKISMVGVSNKEEQRSNFQLFLDILEVYMNSVYYIGIMLTSAIFLYSDRLLNTKEGNTFFCIAFSIYILLLILI